MSFLTENPDMMMEALCVLVRRAVTIKADESPGPFNLISKWAPGELHLVLEEGLTPEEVRFLQIEDAGIA
jgi:hypothetical protein